MEKEVVLVVWVSLLARSFFFRYSLLVLLFFKLINFNKAIGLFWLILISMIWSYIYFYLFIFYLMNEYARNEPAYVQFISQIQILRKLVYFFFFICFFFFVLAYPTVKWSLKQANEHAKTTIFTLIQRTTHTHKHKASISSSYYYI